MFTCMFVFVIFWTISLLLYFTDAFVSYSFGYEVILTSVTTIFTFVIVAVVVDSLLNIAQVLAREPSKKSRQLKFRICAFFCILSQVLNMILANLEKETDHSKEYKYFKLEHNVYYAVRNFLSTISICVLSYYL